MKRVEALTGARAIAAVYILFFHFGAPLFAHAPKWAETLRGSGWAATSYFIMLSGFVLTIAYGGKLTDGRLGQRRFLAARIARLYPCYALALVLLLPMAIVHRWGAVSATFGDASLKAKIATGLAHATMAHVLVPRLIPSWNLPDWCVSVEMWFYVAFPVAVAWMLTRRGRTLAALLVGLWAVAMTIAIAYTVVEPDGFRPDHDSAAPWLTFFKFTPYTRWPEFFFGCTLGALWTHLPAERRGARFATPLLAGGTLAAIAVLVAGARVPYTLLHNGALLPCYAAIVWGLMLGHGPLHRVLALRPITALGESSYALYTLQLPLMSWLISGRRSQSRALHGPRHRRRDDRALRLRAARASVAAPAPRALVRPRPLADAAAETRDRRLIRPRRLVRLRFLIVRLGIGRLDRFHLRLLRIGAAGDARKRETRDQTLHVGPPFCHRS